MALSPIEIGFQNFLLFLPIFRLLLISQFLAKTEHIAEINVSIAILLQTSVNQPSQIEMLDDMIVRFLDSLFDMLQSLLTALHSIEDGCAEIVRIGVVLLGQGSDDELQSFVQQGPVLGFGVAVVLADLGEGFVDDGVAELLPGLLGRSEGSDGRREHVVLGVGNTLQEEHVVLACRIEAEAQFGEGVQVVEGVQEFALAEMGVGSEGEQQRTELLTEVFFLGEVV
jgi:hypothetical protein